MINKLFVTTLILLLMPAFVSAVAQQGCQNFTKVDLKPDWDPRALAGEYRVEWVTETGSRHHTARLRLFLWPSSMRDLSRRTHKGPPPRDTVDHPLYGDMVADSGDFTKERVQALKKAIDPIYPPVLLLSRIAPNPPHRPVLLFGTVGNARDATIGLDGGGVGMWIREADANWFKGTFEPWGIIDSEKGHYCARRVRTKPS